MTSESNMIFDATPDIVWVSIAGRYRKPCIIEEEHHEFVSKFMKWVWEEKIWPFKTTSCGGGEWHGAFFVKDWPRVKEWLEKNGANEGSYERAV